MAWRGVHVTEPAQLSLRERRLVVAQDDGEVALPLEDLAWMVLDTPQVTASAALLSACMEEGVAIVLSDAKHMPAGMLLPFHRHYAQAEVARTQMSSSEPLKKRLWRAIVRRKLENQAANLDRGQIDGGNSLREMARRVKSGDPDNVEARGARFYWGRLFDDFRRHDEADVRNTMLNYGYAVLRAATARALVAAGLLPAFGIHHAGALNAFNLADDLLEVIRPLADWRVLNMADHGRPADDARLGTDERRQLAAIATETLIIDGEQMTVLPALDRVTASLVRALSGDGDKALRLPHL